MSIDDSVKQSILLKLKKIENAVSELKEMLSPQQDESEEALDNEKRKACPKCGSLNFTKMEDKKNVIYYSQGQPIYAKKGVCTQCGTEFSL